MAAQRESLREHVLSRTSTIQTLRNVSLQPSSSLITDLPNALAGIQVIKQEKSDTPHTQRFSVAQYGVTSGYLDVTYKDDGTPTGIILATRIPKADALTLGYQHALMITRDPQTGKSCIKESFAPLHESNENIQPYPLRDAQNHMQAVTMQERQLVDPARILLQTSSLYQALTDSHVVGYAPYIQQMLREVRKSVFLAGLPSHGEIPLLSSVDFSVAATFPEPTKDTDFMISFQTMRVNALTDHFVIKGSNSKAPPFLSVVNKKRGISYETDGEHVYMKTPSGKVEISGLESVAVLEGMRNAVEIAKLAALGQHADSFFAAQQSLTKSNQLVDIITAEKNSRDLNLDVKSVTALTTTVDALTDTIDLDTYRSTALFHHLDIISKRLLWTDNGQTAISSRIMGKEITLQTGKDDMDIPTLMGNQMLYALEHASISEVANAKDPLLLPLRTPLGQASVAVEQGKIITKLNMIGHDITLVLQPQTGRARIERLNKDNLVDAVLPLHNNYALYLAAQLSAILTDHTRKPELPSPTTSPTKPSTYQWKLAEHAARAFIYTALSNQLDAIHSQPISLRIVPDLRVYTHTVPNQNKRASIREYTLIGRSANESTASNMFALSIPTIKNKKVVELKIEGNGGTLELILDRDTTKERVMRVTISHPYDRRKDDVIIPIHDQKTSDKLKLLAELILYKIGTNENFDSHGSHSKTWQKIAENLGRKRLSFLETAGLGRIETILRLFADLPLRSVQTVDTPSLDSEEWLINPAPTSVNQLLNSTHRPPNSLIARVLRLSSQSGRRNRRRQKEFEKERWLREKADSTASGA